MHGFGQNLEWVYLDPKDALDAHEGELVSSEPGGMPIYRVLSLEGGLAKLRDLVDGAVRTCPMTAFHWKALAPRI